MSVNIWDYSYEEKTQLNKCDLRARLKAGLSILRSAVGRLFHTSTRPQTEKGRFPN